MTALELADRLASGWPALEDVNEAVRELRRLAELERDALRYRWLREGCNVVDSEAERIALRLWGQHWDAAIDAAMEQSK